MLPFDGSRKATAIQTGSPSASKRREEGGTRPPCSEDLHVEEDVSDIELAETDALKKDELPSLAAGGAGKPSLLQTGRSVLLSLRTRVDSRAVKFLGLTSGMFSMMTLSCYFEEWIFKALPGFDFFWMVAFVELVVFAAAGCAQRARAGISTGTRSAPFWLYAAAASSLALNQSMGKVLFRYVNYATGMVLKSIKLVPTIIVSTIWLRRRHPLSEWAAAMLLVASASMMVLGDARSSFEFNPLGLLFASANVVLAAFQSLFQDKALREYNAPISECLLYSNTFGAAIVLIVMILSGELLPATSFFAFSPLALLLLVVRSLTFLVGTLAYTALIKEYGAVAATAAATARKIVSVLVSFALFPKPFQMTFVLGVAAFCAADLIYLQGNVAAAKSRLKSAG